MSNKEINCGLSDIVCEIASLPKIQGFGNLSSLHEAMAGNASLKALVTQFTQPTLSSNERNALINSIIYKWAGVESIDPNSRAASMIYGNAANDIEWRLAS